jgi:hypothetical protein
MAQEHLDDVYRYLVFLTADPVLAEDLTGETFEKAFRSWKRFDPRCRREERERRVRSSGQGRRFPARSRRGGGLPGSRP